MKRALFAFSLAAAFVFTGCSKNSEPETPVTPPEQSNFTIEQTALTQGSLDVRITPKDNESTYYFNVISKKDYESLYESDGKKLSAAYKAWFEELASANGLTIKEFLDNALLSGMQNYQFRVLVPETDYVFFVYGVDNEGNSTTDVETLEFKTPKVTLNKNATFNIDATEIGSTWFKVKISCTDPDIFYYYDVMDPSVYQQYCGSDPANIPAYMTEYLTALKSENDTYAAMSEAEFISGITVEGEVEYDTALSEAANTLLPELEYPVFAIACTPDGQPKTGSKLNVGKHEVKMKAATKTNAVYSINVFNVAKTSAQVSVSVNTAGEGQTFLTNYITKAELDSRLATMSESEALKKHMDELIDANLKAWNASHSEMDRKEFLSRVLPGESKTGTGDHITIDGLSAGTDYYAYVIGIKADGTYTTEPFKKAFSTIADKQSKIKISTAMTGMIFEAYFPGKVTYSIDTNASPYDDAGKVYGKLFQGTDEWAGKSADEILAELTKDENKGETAQKWHSYVNWTEEGVKFYVYSIGYDTDGVATDIIKCSHTGKMSECGNEINKTVTFDKTETIAVSR